MRTCPIRGDENIKGQCGRVKISLKIDDDARGRRSLIELNSIPDGDDFLSVVEDIPIWEIMILEEVSEAQVQQTIYSGFVAMDQIIRNTPIPENIYSSRGSMEVIGSI